jgi:ABC-type nitrate/sulfonate/bicarbonate transport system permease component
MTDAPRTIAISPDSVAQPAAGAASAEEVSFPRVRRLFGSVLAPALLILVFLAIWQFVPPALGVAKYILPTPTQIGVQVVGDWSLLWPNFLVTLSEVLLGFALAFAVAMVLGFAVAHSRILNRAIYPLLVASQTVPVIAIAPIFIIWFGYGILPKVIITALICFFPLTVNTVAGYAAVDQDARMLFRAHGASRWNTFRLLTIPSALPSMFSGVKISITLSVIGATIGEYVGSQEGLGHVIVQASGQIITARVFAAIVLLSFMGISLFLIASLIERIAMPWRADSSS